MQPGPMAKKAVIDLLNTLATEAAQQGRRPHPRRLAQWSRLVYRMAVYLTGSCDFTTIPDEATRILRYAFPAPSADEFASWQQIAASVVDTVGAAIEEIRVKALAEFREVSKMEAEARTARVGKLGGMLAAWQMSLKQIGGDDPRVAETIAMMKKWFANAVMGEMPGEDQ